MAPREEGFELDLESGGSTSEEDASLELVSSKGPKKKFLSSDLGGLLSSNESVVCTCGIESSSSSEKSGEVTNDSVELLIKRNSEVEESQGHMTLAEKTSENEWRRKTNSRNAPKPPRPPRGPSLDAADQKLVREITELAKRKRARIEQRKAAKKMKASKSSSLQSGISAMIITLLFFFVIIFQGISSRSVPNVIMQGSPEPAVVTEGLVSVQLYKSSLPNSTYQGVPHMAPREKGFELDLESGGSTRKEDASLELASSKGPKKKFLSNDLGGLLSSNESVVCTCGIESSSSSEKSGEVTNDSVELLIKRNSEVEESQGHMTLAEKTSENEWRRKTNSRNAPKPPRPPRGPSLDAADQKLVREITELAKRKCARIEQRKAAKKMKASKSSSLQSGISAMIITLLFFFVIIFRGISSRSVPNAIMQGSPEPAVATEVLL